MSQQEKTIRGVTRKLKAKFLSELDSVVLYGSTAKGMARPDSDIDILILTRKKKKIGEKVFRLTCQVDLQNSTVTLPLCYRPSEFRHLLNIGSPFAEEIVLTGVPLYDSGTFERVRRAMLGPRSANHGEASLPTTF